jgi:hypothetical protein
MTRETDLNRPGALIKQASGIGLNALGMFGFGLHSGIKGVVLFLPGLVLSLSDNMTWRNLGIAYPFAAISAVAFIT